MRSHALKTSVLRLLVLGLLLVAQPAVAEEMFIAIGDQILKAPKAPVTTDPADLPVDAQIFQQDGLTFNGLVYAGDGLLYVCADNGANGLIFRFDPFGAAAPLSLGTVETVNIDVTSPRCGTVDVDGSLVVASGEGGIYKIPEVAGMCPDDPDDPSEVVFCVPYGSLSTPLAAVEITGDDTFGPVADVAYFYNSDFLSLVAASSGGGQGQGQGRGTGGSKGQLLRSIWPGYQSGLVTEGCPPGPDPENNKNTKILLDDLGAPTGVALSGGEIFVTDGKSLVRVDIPDPTGPFPACVDEPAAETLACESFGNLQAASLAGDVGGSVVGTDVSGSVLVGTGSKNKDAVVYRVDRVPAGCEKEALLIFPKQDWETTISGLALVPNSLEPMFSLCSGPDCPSGVYEATIDGSHTYTLEADCASGPLMTAGPETLGTALAHINSIPPDGDKNTPGFNAIIGSPSAFPGYDGFPWIWQEDDCENILGEIYERHIISSYQRGTNLRIGATNDTCDPWNYPGDCESAYIQLEFNVPFDPDLVPVDPIGGRRRGTRTFLSAAAIANTDNAEFCGFQSPLSPGFDPLEEPVPVIAPPTTLPVKFKLVEEGSICGSGPPVINATVMISVARIEAENATLCPDFEVIFPLESNGAGTAGPPPLFDDPASPNGNFHYNLSVSPADYCDGLYLITATFLTDNAVEQRTLFRVD